MSQIRTSITKGICYAYHCFNCAWALSYYTGIQIYVTTKELNLLHYFSCQPELISLNFATMPLCSKRSVVHCHCYLLDQLQ